MKAFTPGVQRRTAPVSVGNLIIFLGRVDSYRLLTRVAHCLAQAIELSVAASLRTPTVRKANGATSSAERRCAIMRRFMASSKGGFVKTHGDNESGGEDKDDGCGGSAGSGVFVVEIRERQARPRALHNAFLFFYSGLGRTAATRVTDEAQCDVWLCDVG
jgi:hypothetical protein